jgi:predicted GNAT superfamily acetyltransferase
MVRDWRQSDIDWILALNGTAVTETSPLERQELRTMLERSRRALVVEGGFGFVIAFDEASGDDGDNYAWFLSRYRRFLYVDRIVVAESARGKGLAAALYRALANIAATEAYPFIGCEVNVEPPNPVSLAFHANFGFQPIADRRLSPAKMVRYLRYDIV